MKPQIPWSWRHGWHPGIGFHALVSNLPLPRHTHPEEARTPKDMMLISHHFHCSLTHSSFIAREEVLQITNFQSLIVDLMTAHDIEFVFLIVTTAINTALLRLRGMVLNVPAVNDTAVLPVVSPHSPLLCKSAKASARTQPVHDSDERVPGCLMEMLRVPHGPSKITTDYTLNQFITYFLCHLLAR